MEANMIPFRHPGQERRRLSIFVAVLATLALVLAFFVVDGGRNWDRVHRFFSYGTEQVQISMDTAPGALGELDGRLVTAGAEGVTLYDKDGKVSFLAAASLTSPVVQGDGGYILAYDAGGTTIVLLDGKGEVRWEGSLPGPVYDADLTEDGYLCYVSAGSAVKSELQLLDREQRSVFAVHGATRYFTGCAAAPGGGAVCAVSLEERDGAVSSVAVVYRTDREDPVAEVDLGNQVIFDLQFWGKSWICALGEEELLVFNTKGEILGRYDAGGVTDFDLGGDGFAALVLPGSGGQTLVTVNAKGEELGRLALTGGVTTDKIFDMVEDLRKDVKVPMVFMTYANVVFSYGIERFAKKAATVGMDGVILPDVPFEEKEEFASVFRKEGMDLISLIAPTSHDRISMIAKEAEGFVYCVSSLGVTGMRSQITTDVGAMVELVKKSSDIPAAIGFGISGPEQAKKMAAVSDGVIVGSAIVKMVEKYGKDAVPYVAEFVKSVKDAIRE